MQINTITVLALFTFKLGANVLTNHACKCRIRGKARSLPRGSKVREVCRTTPTVLQFATVARRTLTWYDGFVLLVNCVPRCGAICVYSHFSCPNQCLKQCVLISYRTWTNWVETKNTCLTSTPRHLNLLT